jgi:hypothetical protein
VLGEEHPLTAASYNNVASCLNAQGKHALERRAMEVLTVWTQDEREAYELRLKAQRDEATLLHEAREDGIEEGIKKGIEQGILIGQIRAYQEILKQPPTPEVELAKLPQQDLVALLAQLRKQLLPNGA